MQHKAAEAVCTGNGDCTQQRTCRRVAMVTLQLMPALGAPRRGFTAAPPGVLLPESEADQGLVMRLKLGTSTASLSLRHTTGPHCIHRRSS